MKDKIVLSFSQFVIFITIAFMLGAFSFPFIYTFVTGDFPGSAVMFGIQEDSWIVTLLLSISLN